MRRILAGLAVLLVATACSKQRDPGIASVTSGAASSSSSSRPNSAAAFQRFAGCMRQHGQNMPDPDAQGSVDIHPPAGGDAAAWDAAMQACQHYLPAGNGSGFDPHDLDKLRAYAACMRRHGIELSDPDPTTGKGQFEGRLAHASRAQIENDPQYKAANDACKDKLPKNGKDQ
jgi:hypothetical protein